VPRILLTLVLVSAPLFAACGEKLPDVISCPKLKIPHQVEAGGASTCTEWRGSFDQELIDVERRMCEPHALLETPCPATENVGGCKTSVPYASGVVESIDYYYPPIPPPHTTQTLEKLCPGTWVVGSGNN
jgi:hypothetical protein